MVCGGVQGAYLGSVGLFDILVLPVFAYQIERAKLHVAFVYDNDERVLYRYRVKSRRPSGLTTPWNP